MYHWTTHRHSGRVGSGEAEMKFLYLKATLFVDQVCCPLCKQLYLLLVASDTCEGSLLWKDLKGTRLKSGMNGPGDEAQPLVTQALVS